MMDPIVENTVRYGNDMVFDSPPYSVRDLTGVDSQLQSVPTQEAFIGKMVGAMRYFFSRKSGSFSDHFSNPGENYPFKGFVFHGPPGSGKTEAVIEAGRRLYIELADEAEVRLFHISTGDISRKNYGESEERLARIFNDAREKGNQGTRTILLFDDIDTLLMSRDDTRSQEWTVSLGGSFFHLVDRLQTNHTMICATTNKEKSLDDAVKSRLWVEEAPPPTIDEMKIVARSALPIGMVNGKTSEELLSMAGERIEQHVANGKDHSFRLARMASIEVLIREVVGWE